jgi:hypothetical protein
MYKKLILSFLLALFTILKMKTDIYITFSCFIIVFLLSFLIIEKIITLIKDGMKIWNIIYLILVFLILVFPIKNIDSKEIDTKENRKLNKKSQLFLDNKINLNFGKETEEWLSDHFYKRDLIIKKNNKLNEIIKNRVENDIAFLGKEDWIFYKGDNSVLNYQNINLFSKEELEHIKNVLVLRKKYFDSKKSKYYTIIAPDKNKIYGDKYYPKYIKKMNSIGRAKQLQLYLESLNIEGLSIIYPYERLLNESKKNLTYWKNDTHWNTYGAYIGYLELIKEIKKDFPDIQEVNETDINISERAFLNPDLLKLLSMDIEKGLEKYKNVLYKTLSLKKENFDYVKNAGKDGRDGIITKSNKKYKVLVFRDSFTNSMVPYISQTFGEVSYIWSHDLNQFENIVNDYKPDIVIYESVERYIENLKNDFYLKEK